MVVDGVFDSVQSLQSLGVLGLQCLGRASGDTARQKRLVVGVEYSMSKKITIADGDDGSRG